MSYLEKMEIPLKDVGIPTSFQDSGQQWDGRYDIKQFYIKGLHFFIQSFSNPITKYRCIYFQ